MARVVRIAVNLPGSNRWAANLTQGGFNYRFMSNGELKWVRLLPTNTKISKLENGQIVWLPVI